MKAFRADPVTILLGRCLSLRITRGVVIRPVVSSLLFPLEMRNGGERGERGRLILLERLTNYISPDKEGKKKLRIPIANDGRKDRYRVEIRNIGYMKGNKLGEKWD